MTESTPARASSSSGETQAPRTSPDKARLGWWLCLAGAAIGALGLLDWIGGTGFLTAIVPGDRAMTPNTALGLLLIGGAGALRDREDAGPTGRLLSLLAAFLVLALGIGTIAEYALGIDLLIDRLIPGGVQTATHPGRPAPATALALTLLAAALLTFDCRARSRARPSEWLIVAAGFTALTALLGFVFGAELRHRVARLPLIGMALPTAIGLLLTAVGLLFERSRTGMMEVATSPGPGGMQLRRLALPAIVVPAALGFVVTFPLQDLGAEALSLVVAVLAAAMTVVGLFVLTVTAASLNRTYAALESNRAQTRALVEQAPDAVFVADLAGRYTDVNSAGCRLLGYPREEIIGKAIVDVILPGDSDRLLQERDQLLKGDTLVNEWMLRRKDGSHVPVEVSAKIFPDGRWQGLMRDISERKRLEAELRAAEAEQKFLADFGSALVSTIDDRETAETVARQIVGELADACSLETLEEDGQLHDRVFAHREARMAAVSRRLENVKLDPSRPYLGSAARTAKRPLLIGDVTPAYLDSIAQGAAHRQALGELAPTAFMALPLLAHGGVVGSLVFISTTAGRRYTPDHLPFAEEVAKRAALAVEKARLYRFAQHAIRLRDDVLSVVAHDLRNPLGTILLQTGLLRGSESDHGPRSRKPAEVIERAATRMNHLIQDLLDVARMEGGRLSIERQRVSARQAVVDAASAQEPLATSAALELRLDLAPDLPEVWADRERLLQIFENLIGNALKFTEAGGSITVGAAPRDGEVLFWVADTGVGIATEDLPHVFERLWQAMGAGLHGAGLGLPIVKGIVDAHGGRLWVESAPGQGSTFSFTIPTAAPADDWHRESAPHGP